MKIQNLNLAVTTFCSMACPDCHIDIPRRKDKQHYPLEYFERAAKFLRGAFRVIVLTGGEPSLHPKFGELAVKIRELFQPERLHVETNGFLFDRNPEAFRTFDEVTCTIYQPDSFDGCPDNGHKIAAYKAHFGEKSNLVTGKTVFVPRSLRPGKNPCARLGILAYYDGLLFPCCAGPGLPTKVGIPLTDNWRSEIENTLAPCDGCFFALP